MTININLSTLFGKKKQNILTYLRNFLIVAKQIQLGSMYMDTLTKIFLFILVKGVKKEHGRTKEICIGTFM